MADEQPSVVNPPVDVTGNLSVVDAGREEAPQNGQTDEQTDAPQTDAKPEGDAKPQTEEKPAAPEKYEFTMPEGFEVDEGAMEQVTPLLRDLGLSQEQAQKLADFHFGQIQRLAEQQAQARQNVIDEWTKQLIADRDIGGADLKANLVIGGRLLHRFGSADLDTLLKESGLDRHPAMVRFLVNAGRELAEDRWADGGKRGAAVRTAGDVAKQIFDKTL